MQKFDNIDKWQVVSENKGITFPYAQPVTLEVSTPNACDWYIPDENGELEYFATTSGRDVFTFVPWKGMTLVPDYTVRCYTIEQEMVQIEDDGSASYTGIPNRQVRNPEMEKVAHIAAMNATRNLAAFYGQELAARDEQIAQLGERVHAATSRIDDQATAGDTVTQTLEEDGAGDTGSTPAASREGSGGASDDDSQGGESE